MEINTNIETNISLLNEDFNELNIQHIQFKADLKNKHISWDEKNEHLKQIREKLVKIIEKEEYLISNDPKNLVLHIIIRHDERLLSKISNDIRTLYSNCNLVWLKSNKNIKNDSILNIKNILKRIIGEKLNNAGYILTGSNRFFNQWIDPNIEEIDFEIRDPYEIQNLETVLHYPGFIFRITNYNNSYGIAIDRSNLMIIKRTLKDLEPNELNNLERRVKNGERIQFWDCCPNFKCKFVAENPCNLSPLTKTSSYYLSKFDYSKSAHDFKPKDSGKTILEFAQEECKLNIIQDFISNSPPLAIVKTYKGREYTFPLERLREKVDFRKIKKREDRQEIMDFLRSSPDERRFGILKQLEILKEFESFGRILGFNQTLYNGINNGILDIPKRKIGKSKNVDDPYYSLYKYGPIDYSENLNKTLELIVISTEKCDDIVNDLIYGVPRNAEKQKFHGLQKMFKFQKITVKYLTNIDEIKKDGDNQVVFAVISSKSDNIKSKIYKKCFEEQIGVQCTIPDNNRTRYLGKLRNISLGLYHNLGRNSWHLSKKMDYISIGLKYDNKIKLMMISVVGHYGEWKYGLIEKVENIRETLVRLNQKITTLEVKSQIEIHWHGEIFDELNDIIEILNPRRIILVKDNIGPIRLFDRSMNDKKPQTGSYVILDSRNGLLASSVELVREGTPKPIKIELKYPNDEELTKEIIERIHMLARVNQHVTHGLSKLPITIHYPKLMLEKYNELGIYPHGFQNIAWFV